MKTIPTLISAIALPILLTIPSYARLKAYVSYDDLVAKADLIAIIEPIENESAKDPYPGLHPGFAQKDFVATNTKFRVHAYLKGGDAAEKEITILHFSYSKDVGIRSNGASFITFIPGPLQYEKKLLKDDKPVGVVTVYEKQQVWLAFLKKRTDGRFDPISDPYDSADSFREIHKPFYTTPTP